MKRLVATAAICTIVVVLGIACATVLTGMRAPSDNPNTVAAIPMEEAPGVKVQVLEHRNIDDALELTGSVAPWQEVTLSAEVTGQIEAFEVEEGAAVTEGQLICRMDTALLNARLEELQAQATLAKQELDRLQSLRERGVGSVQDLDRASAEQAVVQASLKGIRTQLEKSNVRSPIEGVVDDRFGEPGEFVDAGRPLARVVDVDRVKVVVGIPERDVPNFAEGDPVHVRLDALPDQQFEGVIHRIATSAEPATRTFETEIAVDNASGVLKPGMIARTKLVRRNIPDAIVVPMFAVISLDDRRITFVEKEGKAEMRPVEIGVLLGSEVQITEGLNAGDRLIIAGQRDARPGHSVTVTEVVE